MRGLPTEKSSLPSTVSLSDEQPKQTRFNWVNRHKQSLVLLLGSLLPFQFFVKSDLSFNGLYQSSPLASNALRKSSCEQADAIYPKVQNVSSLVVGQKERIIDWISGAVQVPTETFDDFGKVGEDDRWDKFYKFDGYLKKSFPSVYQNLKHTPVYTHAHLFEWEGSDPSLKPLLLTGHTDTVPVLPASRHLWKHDPFSGYYDGEFIWGRGSSDDKSGVIGILSAVELLLESGKFKPARTVILAFGNDEEIAGNGALHLSQLIEEKYGKDSIAILVDEGNKVDEAWGQVLAAPAVAEKGSQNIEIRVETQGGHSSVPPSHTGIGYISLLIAALEAHPHVPELRIDSPLVSYLTCAAEVAPKAPRTLKKAAKSLVDSLKSKKGKYDKKALKVIEEWWITGSYEDGTLNKGQGKAMVSTTQAVDIINGGLKVNALPESVSAIVNHRINIISSIAELEKRIIDVISPTAIEFNLSLEAFGKDIKTAQGPKAGKVILSSLHGIDPAPITPFTLEDPAWRVFSGTTKGVYATRPQAYLNEEEAKREIFTVPALSTGNTDTRQYWNLTSNIYRFAYQSSKNPNIHTVNEALSADAFVEQVRWFLSFIVNVDEATDL
ncbi:uncharacterized protein IL334_005578 [Kwoniella shivajii]|uniref:Peptidase M20 dimerisation domain-containing protein n=1 Tax=Kwoniella shivajii TaxID=564305 RepID=A0ABZ1D5E0_9TREE|nr:hypothetical protein IL334_005578 [Kwoniella shivajii]